MKVWKNKNGRIQYPLPNCKICGKRSNTTDKQTAQIAERKGRICQDCTEAIKKDPKIPIPADKETIWQKIKRLFK